MAITQTFNSPSYVSLRPLSKGIDRDTPPHLLEIGAFLDLQNVAVRRGGLERRGGYGTFYDGLKALDERIIGSPLWYDSEGIPIPILVTRKHVYLLEEGPVLTRLSPTLYEGRASGGDEGQGDVAAASDPQLWTLTVTGATFTTGPTVTLGDTVWIADEPYEILVVTDTVLTFRDHLGTMTAQTSIDYDVVEAHSRVPDWTISRDFSDSTTYFIWTDNSGRPLRRYDGISVTDVDLVTSGTSMQEIDTVTDFGGRLWAAGMTEGGVDERFRIRWTSVTNKSEFPNSQFVDVQVRRYGISRLIPLGSLLVAYFRDGVYFGRPTNIANLPYDFSPYDTGNIGLVGRRAITPWLDAHWFVGQDDIYSFSASRALERIGTKIVQDTIRNPDVVLEDTLVVPDPINERIVFQFFNISGVVEVLWCYYYKTGAWATETTDASLSYFYGRTVDSTTWDDVLNLPSGEQPWTATGFQTSWFTLRPVIDQESLFRSRDGGIEIYLPGSRNDTATGLPVEFVMESGDFDFGTPNVVKAVTQLSLKLEQPTTDRLEFRVSTASNRGTDFRYVGALVIPVGADEGKVDFRQSGSLFRFKVVETSAARPWTINEVVLVASEIGRESVFS